MSSLKTYKSLKASSLIETVMAMSITVFCLAIAAFVYMNMMNSPDNLTLFKQRQNILLNHLSKEYDIVFDTDYTTINTPVISENNKTCYILKKDTVQFLKPKLESIEIP